MPSKKSHAAPTLDTLLVEVLAEELPPKQLFALGFRFQDEIRRQLIAAGFLTSTSESGQDVRVLATPRRLAALIPGVFGVQPDRVIERKGPAASVALDAANSPTAALMGFAKSCGVPVEQLERVKDGRNDYFLFRMTKTGEPLSRLLPEIVENSLAKLPILRSMRWGTSDAKFVRPVQGVVMMHGARVIPGMLIGSKSVNRTLGHRFLCGKPVTIKHANNYERVLLDQGKVIASFDARKAEITRQIQRYEDELNVNVLLDTGRTRYSSNVSLRANLSSNWELSIAKDVLLDEVTALVEYPKVLAGKFENEFLELPMECLTLSMRQHQRYFPCFGHDGRLASIFLFVSNVESFDSRQVIHGNQRVLRARLADAKFFYDQDRKISLEARVPKLAYVIYHNKLGSQLEHVERIRWFADKIAQKLGAEPSTAKRAAYLCKADRVTEMVGEFPELQGIMGRYYALHDNEPAEIARAIEEHYWPRHAGDVLPTGNIAISVALADKLLSVVALFRVGERPTGDKDPLGLRRQALGVLRMLVERSLALDLVELIRLASESLADPSFSNSWSAELQRQSLERSANTPGLKMFATAVSSWPVSDSSMVETHDFFLERLRGYVREKNYSNNEIESVLASRPTRIDLVIPRLQAVQAFRKLPEADALAGANKRIRNILRQAKASFDGVATPSLLEEDAELELYREVVDTRQLVESTFDSRQYTESLVALARLRPYVDRFFDKVLVNTENLDVRINRLRLLGELDHLMNRVADISKLAA